MRKLSASTASSARSVVPQLSALLPDRWQPGDFISLLPVAIPPIAAGIAILRYRLYDIDIIIRCTLVYGTLTATLALSYFGSIVVLQTLRAHWSGPKRSL